MRMACVYKVLIVGAEPKVMLSIVLSCSVSFANFLMALPRSYIHAVFRRACGTYFLTDTILAPCLQSC